MKAVFKIAPGIVAAAALVVVGFSAGWLLWGRRLWSPAMDGPGLSRESEPCDSGDVSAGIPAVARGYAPTVGDASPSTAQGCPASGTVLPIATKDVGVQEARGAAQAYVMDLGYDSLEIAELLEFEYNYCAIVRERDTGIGAMELLVDKTTAAVEPEMGPNMIWNVRYGINRRAGMVSDQIGETNSLSQVQAIERAQRWLDANRPGVTADEYADPFYGYYTIHTMVDGEIEGMLSVHGNTGRVWYHSWHGDFVRMVENDEHG